MERGGALQQGLLSTRGAAPFSALWVVLSDADLGGRAEATQRESLQPEMEPILPGLGRQRHEGPVPTAAPHSQLVPRHHMAPLASMPPRERLSLWHMALLITTNNHRISPGLGKRSWSLQMYVLLGVYLWLKP